MSIVYLLDLTRSLCSNTPDHGIQSPQSSSCQHDLQLIHLCADRTEFMQMQQLHGQVHDLRGQMRVLEGQVTEVKGQRWMLKEWSVA